MSFKFKFKDTERFKRITRERPVKWLQYIKNAWSKADNITVGEIIKSQLSGRRGGKGLKRISGQAARALNVKTQIVGKNVISTLFIPLSNPAAKYLPIHDKSRKGDGVIRPKNKEYLHFKTPTGWVKTKEVHIPVRTNILEYYMKTGGKRRAAAVVDSFKVLAHG